MEKFWLQGHAINTFELNGTSFPLIYGGDAPNVSAGASGDISRFCDPGSLNSYKVQGKIILCDGINGGSGITKADGLGTIMSDSEYSDFAFSYALPATLLTIEDGVQALNYVQSTE